MGDQIGPSDRLRCTEGASHQRENKAGCHQSFLVLCRFGSVASGEGALYGFSSIPALHHGVAR